MDKDLLTKALTKYLLGVIVLGLLLFLPAGSLHYWQGWLLMGILFVPMAVAGIVMMAKNPELLRKRLKAKEKEAEQKTVVTMSGMLFVIAFVLAGLNWLFDWYVLPDWVVWVFCRSLPDILSIICRGHAREHIPLTHRRGSGQPEGH